MSRAAAPSLGWHRISICLVKLKVCTAPKSEPGRAEGRREAGSWEHGRLGPCQRGHADTPLLFIPPPALPEGPILPLGQGEWPQCREDAEKLRMLSARWPSAPLGQARKVPSGVPTEQPRGPSQRGSCPPPTARDKELPHWPLLGGADLGTPGPPPGKLLSQPSPQGWARPGVPAPPGARGSLCPPRGQVKVS